MQDPARHVRIKGIAADLGARWLIGRNRALLVDLPRAPGRSRNIAGPDQTLWPCRGQRSRLTRSPSIASPIAHMVARHRMARAPVQRVHPALVADHGRTPPERSRQLVDFVLPAPGAERPVIQGAQADCVSNACASCVAFRAAQAPPADARTGGDSGRGPDSSVAIPGRYTSLS